MWKSFLCNGLWLKLSAKPKQSLAELCNIWISEKVKAKFDYSSATSRQLDIQNFMKAHKSQIPPEQYKTKTIRDSFMPQLKKVFDISISDQCLM